MSARKYFSMIFVFLILLSSMFVPVSPGFAQEADGTNEILVYFSSGVIRTTPGQSEATILTHGVRGVLNRFNINDDAVEAAFPHFNEADTVHVTPSGRVIKLPNMAKVMKITISQNIDSNEIIEAFEQLPIVVYAESNGLAIPLTNDPLYEDQWALENVGQTGGIIDADIDAPEAWDIYTGDPNSIIAIVDGGLSNTSYESELFGKVLNPTYPGDGLDWDYHGPRVAAIAAAWTNNGEGIAGVDWQSKLYDAKVSNLDFASIAQTIIDAVDYSPNVHVLNNSWSLGWMPDAGSNPEAYSLTVHLAFAYAYKMNKVVTAAMGYSPGSNNEVKVYPAGFDQGVMAVGATDHDDDLWDHSPVGEHIDVVAPGVNIMTRHYSNSFSTYSGTSYAVPFVSGIASLLKGYRPDLDNDDIERIIELTADKPEGMEGLEFTTEYGFGRVNAHKALQAVQEPFVLRHRNTVGSDNSTFQNQYPVLIAGADGLQDGWYYVKRHEVRKQVNYPRTVNPVVWGRGVETIGWPVDSPYPNQEQYQLQLGLGWCEPIPGSVTETSATLRTYIYEVLTLPPDGRYIGTFPSNPSGVEFAYTVWGEEPPPFAVSISGPSLLSFKESGTWTANTDNGIGGPTNYTYEWRHRPLGTTTWSSIYGTDPTFTTQMGNQSFELKVTAIDLAGNTAEDIHVVHSNDDIEFAPTQRVDTELKTSNPNPFTTRTAIHYQLATPGQVTVSIYNVTGQRVVTLVDAAREQGHHQVEWDGRDEAGQSVGSGVYFYRLQTEDGFVDQKRMILMK